MRNGYEVDPDGIFQHADSMRELTPIIDLVLDAGDQVTPGVWDNAYGVACQGFPIALRPIAERQLESVDRLRAALESTMYQLRITAESYMERDRGNEQRLTQLRRREQEKRFHDDIFVPGDGRADQ